MRALRFHLTFVLMATFIGLNIWVPRFAMGQVFGRKVVTLNGRFIEAPRSILSRLREAEHAIQARQINEAIIELGEISARQSRGGQDEDLAGQDFFMDFDDVREGQPASESLLNSVRQMIGDLPEKDLATYELRYGPIARQELEAAAQSRDWHLLESVRRRYFHTLAGYEASYLLAQRQMYDGHPLYASLLLDDVTSNDRAMDHLGVSVFLLHASACSLANRVLPPVDVMAGRMLGTGDEVRSIQSAEELETWIEANVRLQKDYRSSSLMDYTIFGGMANRNGTDVGQMPLSQARWKLPTSSTPRQNREIESMEDELISSGQLPPPSWIPLKVGDQLIMRTTELLLGVDYETGKRLWAKPWESGLEPQDDDEAGSEEVIDAGQRMDSLRQRIWNDVPYGHISSDGTRVFMLSDLSNKRIAILNTMRFRGLRPADASTNTLYALDLESEGKLLWKLGRGGEEESPFADAFFLGPPLPVDGLLYVMAEIAGDINLCCLDPVSGNEVWRQHLVAAESGGIHMDPIRRIAGAMPTYHEGILICPTGAGVTVAINLADRSLRWGATYARNNQGARTNRFGGGNDQRLQRWDVGVAIAKRTSVLLTPPETNRMYCFNLETGQYQFSEQTRMKLRYLAGIRDNKYLLVGSNRVRAFDLEKGTEVWTSPTGMLAAGQQIAGRGVFGDGDYLIPTTTNELIRLSLDTGEILQRRKTRYPLGNLVAVEQDLIVQGPTTLSVAYGEQALEPMVNKLLEENPNDFEAIVRKSELLIEQGRRSEALDLLNRARELEPDNHAVRSLSVTAMLGLLRADPKTGESYVQAATELIEQPSHWIELLALRSQGAMDRGEYVQAAKRLIEMSSRLLTAGQLDGLSDSLINDPSRSCTLDAWLAARMHEIQSQASKEELGKIEEMIETDIADKAYLSTPLMARLRRYYEGWRSVSAIYPVLLDKYQVDQDWMAVERMLVGSRVYPHGEMEGFSPTELWLIAKNCMQASMLDDAERVLDIYEERMEDLDSLSVEEREEIAEMRTQIEKGNDKMTWPKDVQLKDWPSSNNQVNHGFIRSSVGETALVGGTRFAGWTVVSDGNSRLSVRDSMGISHAVSGEALLRGSAANNATISGTALVAMTADSLVCVDLNQFSRRKTSPVRWQRNFSGDGSPIAKRIPNQSKFGVPIYRYTMNSLTAAANAPELVMGPVLGDRVIYLQGGDLMAIDLITKEVLWRHSDAPVQGSVLIDGDTVAVVSEKKREIAFFNVHDGRKISTREWTHGIIWSSIGKHVLSYVNPDRRNLEFEIRLTDPFKNEVLLNQTSFGANRRQSKAPAAYGQIVSGRYLAWMQTDGQALIWDILKGQSIGTPKIPKYPDLTGLQVMELQGKFIFLPARKAVRLGIERIGQKLTTESGQTHRTAHAAIAVDSNTGTTRWTSEFARPWGCTTTQVSGSPLIAFVRSQVQQALTNRPRQKMMDVMLLRADDGSEAFRKEGKVINMNNRYLETKLIAQPSTREVLVNIGSTERLLFQFSEAENEEKH